MLMHNCPTRDGQHEVVLVREDGDAPLSRVLYLLDGNAALAALRPEWLAERPGLVLAAVGYPDTVGFALERRSLDYTPPPPPDWDGGSRRALDRPHGGAAAFLARLSGEIVPAVEAQLGVKNPQRALWGHSYGGLFTLWAAGQARHGFELIHAASPSIWWGDYALEQQILRGDFLPQNLRHLSLSMGDAEISRTGETLVSPARLQALGARLREQGIACGVTILAGASHGSAFERSLALAIAQS